MPLISESEKKRVTDAISAAESQTSGEIVALMMVESTSYLYAPFLWASILALLVPWPLIYFTWISVQWIYAIQLFAFFALLAVFLPRPTRYQLVPRSVKRASAHRRAVEQFMAQNLHTTKGRTGVLIFVSAAERFAEILVDSGIDKKVDEGTWQRIVDGLTAEIGRGRPGDGFVAAVEQIGALLAKHFPPGAIDVDELPNHLIIIE